MKVINLMKYPPTYSYDGELSDVCLDSIPERIQLVVYWYARGSYEGTGQMILIDDEQQAYYHSMSHCSCYGPLEQLGIDFGQPIDALYENFSDELKQQTKEMYEIAKFETACLWMEEI